MFNTKLIDNENEGKIINRNFYKYLFIAGSCNVSSVQGSRYNFSSLDSVIQGWVSKEYYPGASICVVKNDSVIFRRTMVAILLIQKYT